MFRHHSPCWSDPKEYEGGRESLARVHASTARAARHRAVFCESLVARIILPRAHSCVGIAVDHRASAPLHVGLGDRQCVAGRSARVRASDYVSNCPRGVGRRLRVGVQTRISDARASAAGRAIGVDRFAASHGARKGKKVQRGTSDVPESPRGPAVVLKCLWTMGITAGMP